MSVQISEQSPYSISIQKDDLTFLGFLSMTSQKRDENGYIWDGKSLVPWEIRGITEHKKRKYVYGLDFSGTFLADIGKDLDLKTLRFLAEAYANLPETYNFRGLHGYGVIIGKDRILILPETLTTSFLKLGSAADRLDSYDQFNDLSPEHDNLSFSFAVLAYAVLCAAKPYPYKDRAELVRRMSDGRFVPPAMRVPELKEEVSQLIVSKLMTAKKQNASDAAAEWMTILDGWLDKGTERSVGHDEKQNILRQRQKLEKSIRTSQNLSLFWYKHKVRLVIGAAVFALAVVGIVSYIKKATAPPYTLGKSPEQVIEAYYEGFNKIDHLLMEQCVTGKAGKAYIDWTMRMYVVAKQQIAYGTDINFIMADAVLKDGISSSEYGHMIWGITDFSLQKNGDLSYTASYKRWYSIQEDNGDIHDVPIIHYLYDVETVDIQLVRKTYRYGKGKPEYYLISAMDISVKSNENEYKF